MISQKRCHLFIITHFLYAFRINFQMLFLLKFHHCLRVKFNEGNFKFLKTAIRKLLCSCYRTGCLMTQRLYQICQKTAVILILMMQPRFIENIIYNKYELYFICIWKHDLAQLYNH